MRDLDAEYAASHPPTSIEERTFRWQGVNIVRLNDVPLGAFNEIEQPSGATGRNDMRALIAAIRRCLDPVCHADYDRAAQNEDLPSGALLALWQAVVEEAAGRPTQPSAPSSTGPSVNGTPSTPGSSTTEAWASGGSVPGALPT